MSPWLLCNRGLGNPTWIDDFRVRPHHIISCYSTHKSHQKDTIQDMKMASELIADPLNIKRNHVHVRFAETAQLHIVHRHENKNELWYTKAECNSMRRKVKQDVLQVRARDLVSEEDSGF